MTHAPGGVVHPWEYRQALERINRLETINQQLRKYAWYLSARVQSQAMVINEKLSPVVCASLMDDLDDAAQISGIEPREFTDQG